jgi:hypothetical protein
MHTQILHRVMQVPMLREVLGALAGCSVALVLYGAFELARGLMGMGSVDVVGGLHAATGFAVSHGTIGLGLTSTLALAGGCAFIHRRVLQPSTMSEID